MARPRTAKAAPRASLPAGDRTLYTHNLWLNYLKPVSLGLVASPNALRLAQIDLPLQASDAQNALLALTVARLSADGEEDLDPDPRGAGRSLPDLGAFLVEFLGWKPDLLDRFRPGPASRMFSGQEALAPGGDRVDVPDSLRHALPQYEDTLEPSFAYRWEKRADPGTSYALIGLEIPDGVDLDRKNAGPDEGAWAESPQKKFERLMYEAGVPVGVVISPSAVRLVYRPEGQQSGYITFPLDALMKPAGRLACSALRSLLNHDRLQRLPTRQRLHHILAESRKFQNEVSTQLAEQVLAALFELLKGFEAADAESKGRLLAGVRDNPKRTHEIYEGLLTVLMRLVFLLYAEERETFPGDDLFVRNYSIGGLFARLVEDEGRHPDTMDQRFGAWAHLISLFRLTYDGIAYDGEIGPDGKPKAVKVPARRGDLFDPRRFPFLEGQTLAAEPGGWHPLPDVADGTVLRVLRGLLYLQDRQNKDAIERLSYRSLEVEQIGSVYEAVMGYRVEAASGRSVAIRPEKRGGAPVTISLDELLATGANNRVKWFKERTDRKLPAAAASAIRAAKGEADLVSALDKLIDRRLTPAPVPRGSLVIQPSPERRRSGSHYTPRSLTGPIVAKALEPILKRLGPDPTAAQILALKVCDPAMGSGAFLVEAMRQLAQLLVRAWTRHGDRPRIPDDETPSVHASRLVAQRCLYGVDKNPMAVHLAKLSLWLATLARDHAFTFLDHNLRHGDSLVGLTLAQIEARHWAPVVTGEVYDIRTSRLIADVMKKRGEILTAAEGTHYDKLADLRMGAEGFLDFPRLLGDAIIGAFFEEGSAAVREKRRKDLDLTIRDYLGSATTGDPTGLLLRREIEASAHVLASLDPPLKTFHWEIEFPEVFLKLEPDGTFRRRVECGFDAIVGNPPFAGKNTQAEGSAKAFPDWIKIVHPESHGNADLVAHFFRRSFDLLRDGGTFGLIATNTIGQGDTRSTGLRWIATHDGTIYAARKRLKWPGEAAVVVSVVHVHKGPLLGLYDLDGRPVSLITAYLFHSGGHADPERLHANASSCFQGSIILGIGFTFDDTDKKGNANPISRERADQLAQQGERPISMADLIVSDPSNKERIFPYIGGKEFNDRPNQTHHRYIIDFRQMSEAASERWPELLNIVARRVKPDRMRNNREGYRKWWWHHGEKRIELYEKAAKFEKVLARSLTSKHFAFSYLKNDYVFDQTLIVFFLHGMASFCCLSGRVHEVWSNFMGATMKDDPRYNIANCFENFPFPPGWVTNPILESVGQEYYDHRSQLMIEANQGLTKTYNRFHDPKEKSHEIERLRELHAAMDRAVLAAYDFSGIDTTCGFDLDWCEAEAADDASPDTVERLESGRFFFETGADARAFASELIGDGKGLPWRYRWRPESRDDVLARLLLLNGERAAAERAAGLSRIDADEELDPIEPDEEDGGEDDDD